MMHSFDPQIAVKVGVNAAIIYANISWWCAKNKANGHNVHDGRAWTYNSVRAWTELFPYMTAKQVRTALATLEDAGLIVSGEYNESAYDRTKWYAPNVELDLPCKATHSAPEGEPIPVIKPDITKRDTNVSLSAKTDEPSVEDLLCSVTTREAALSFIAYRKKHKAKALTLTAAKKLGQKLADMAAMGLDTADALSVAEENGWATVEIEWYKRKLANGNGNHSQQFANGRNAGNRSPHQQLFDAFQSVAAERSRGTGFDDFGN